MVKSLVTNSSLLITFIYLIDLILHLKPIQQLKESQVKLVSGVLSGLLGTIMMNFSISLNDGIIIDLRHLATIFSAFLGGLPGAFIAALVMAAGRLFSYEQSLASFLGASAILVSGLACGYLSKTSWNPWYQWIAMAAACLGTYTLVLSYLLPDYQIIPVLADFWFFTLAAGALSHSFALYLNRIRRFHNKLKTLSNTDFLTGLSNVRQFHAQLDDLIRGSDKHGEQLSLIVFDVDFFKIVNDTYGHLAGDEVLKKLSLILINSCRSYDIVSRNGGEEFSILLPDCQFNKALDIAEFIRRKVEIDKLVLTTGQLIHITVSAGVSTYPDLAASSEALYASADEALYRAKRDGRNKICGAVPAEG